MRRRRRGKTYPAVIEEHGAGTAVGLTAVWASRTPGSVLRCSAAWGWGLGTAIAISAFDLRAYVRPYGNKASRRPRRGVKWSQVAVPRIGPRTNLHPPTASGGNMYSQRAHLTSRRGAGR